MFCLLPMECCFNLRMYGLNTSVSVGSVVFVFYTYIWKNGNFKFLGRERF